MSSYSEIIRPGGIPSTSVSAAGLHICLMRSQFSAAFLAPCPASGLIVGAERDEVVPLADIQKLVARLSLQKGITVESRTVKGANHFFHDSLDKLAIDVDKYVAKCLLDPPGRATSNKEP